MDFINDNEILKALGSSKLIRQPRWDFFAPFNSTGRVKWIDPTSNARIDPTTQQLIGETCTCRYASTSAPVLNAVQGSDPTAGLVSLGKSLRWRKISAMRAFSGPMIEPTKWSG